MAITRITAGLGLIPASSRPAPTGAPVNVTAPSITGVLTQGQTLTADPGVWSNLPSPAYAYQWKRSGSDIAGEAGQTYVAAAADVSAGAGALSVEVTATNDVGSTVAASAGVTIAAPLAIAWTPPAGQVGVAYSYLPTVTGGHGPYSYALSGTLPSGLSFDAGVGDGETSGTPLSTETASGLSVTVTDADGLTAASGAKSIAVTSGVATSSGLVVANRLQLPSTTTTLNNNLEYTSRREHYATTQGDISDLVFVEVNWTWAFNAPANPGNPTKRKKWVEYPQGTILGQVTHSGGSTDWAEIPDGGQLVWDPFPATIPAGAKFWERTTEKNDSGANRTQVCIELPDTPAHVGVDDGNSITVGIGATGAAIAAGSSHPRTIGSSLIVGAIAVANARGVLMFGDSITLGVADTSGTSAQGGSGWGARTLDREGLPWAKGAIGGQDASAIVANYLADSRFLAFVAVGGWTEVWIAYGTNDLRDSMSVSGVMDSLAAIAGAFPGKTIHCVTVGPRSTSTDGYATVANQTVKTDGNWAGLTALNAAIRARPAWLNGQIIEFADAVMSARDSGLWAAPPAPTPDGTHPNTTCCTAVAAAIAFS